jgi:hypothetical protein
MAGLLTFAWSTTTLLMLAQRFETKQLQHIAQRHRKGGTGPGSAAS